MLRVVFTSILLMFSVVAQSFATDIKEFADSKDWLAMVHYREKMLGGYEGTIDSDIFYISKDGKNNPQAELEATIEMFNSGNTARMCLFPARYKLLSKNGLININYPKCDNYRNFYKELQPSGITLLFTDAYMNNPSSLFGHTLFRVDTDRKDSQLLSYGVNYGAFVDENDINVFSYAVLGLTGGYSGGFTVKPYYEILNQYSNVENRDMWEFQLALTQEELDLFVAHLWELGHSQAQYYFFTKNCSYMLLELLDAVRPSLNLAQEFNFHAIPFDTVRAVENRDGLIKETTYRPSRMSKIKNQYDQMTSDQKKAFLKIVAKNKYKFSKLTDVEQAEVIETAYQYTQYQNVEKEIDRLDYREKSFALLKAREDLKVKSDYKPIENAETPLKAHKSSRVALAFGSRNGEMFQEVALRPAYHSLIDNGYAYLQGAEINFMDISARHYDNSNKYVLQKLDLAGVKSLSPRNAIFKPISYKLSGSIDREMNPDNEKDGYVFNLKGGVGPTYELHKYLWFYTMLNGQVAYGDLNNGSHQWAGAGLSVGTISDFGMVRIILGAENMFATSKYASKMKYNAETACNITKDLYISASYMYLDNYGKNVEETKFGIGYHF